MGKTDHFKLQEHHNLHIINRQLCNEFFIIRYLPGNRTWIGFRDVDGSNQWLDSSIVGSNGFDNWSSGRSRAFYHTSHTSPETDFVFARKLSIEVFEGPLATAKENLRLCNLISNPIKEIRTVNVSMILQMNILQNVMQCDET